MHWRWRGFLRYYTLHTHTHTDNFKIIYNLDLAINIPAPAPRPLEALHPNLLRPLPLRALPFQFPPLGIRAAFSPVIPRVCLHIVEPADGRASFVGPQAARAVALDPVAEQPAAAAGRDADAGGCVVADPVLL
eukprot:scaffold25624_cov99-Isochrysis_galbana.AAC.1